jgi:EmrB/QacA subfamily drug resistance transporter
MSADVNTRQQSRLDVTEAGPHWAVLPVVLAGVFLTGIDFFIVNVAIPVMQADLSASSAEIQWVVAGYALTYGAGMITGGRLGDLFGRRRMFALAMAAFTLTSLLCAVAPNPTFLITARLLQGAAAALMVPQVLAIFSTIYSGEARARAINAYGITLGISAVSAQLIGGLLIKADWFDLDWRLCFLINLPVGIAALLFVRLVPAAEGTGRSKLDLVGVALVTAALLSVVLPLIEGRQEGWPVWAWLVLVASIPLFAVFVLYQVRLKAAGGSPLLDMSLFEERAFSAGLATQLVFWAAQASYFLVFALYVQQGRGMDALASGVLFAAIGVGYMATSTTARWFAIRLGREVIAVGGLTRALGLLLLLLAVLHIGVHGSAWWLVPGLIVDGAGMGLGLAPLATVVLSRVTPQHAGAGAGVLTTTAQVGNAIGVSLIGILFYQQLAGQSHDTGYAHAFEVSLIYLMATGVLVALLVQLIPKQAKA